MSKNIKDLIPAKAIHPGTFILDELEARDISQNEFASQIGMQRSQLNEIIKGKRNIDVELALILEKSLGIDHQFWLNAQQNYDIDKINLDEKFQVRLKSIEIWKMIKNYIPDSFYKKQGFLTGDPILDLPIIKDIYSIINYEELATLQTIPQFQGLMRKSEKLDVDPVNMLGWLKLCEYLAIKQEVGVFLPANKDQLIAELRNVICKNANVLEDTKNILNKAGIKLIYQDKPEKTPIDGYCFQSISNPAIAMSLRYKRIDNFAFTLFHELGHVFLHLYGHEVQKVFIDLEKENKNSQRKPEEVEADEFAMDSLIKSSEWNNFFENAESFTDDTIKAFAKKVKIHPAIVRGRLCHVVDKFNYKTTIDYKIG